MGCDIHFYVEKRANVNAPWVTADVWENSDGEDYAADVPYDKSFYKGRSYDLFSILADVRNGRGFAGVKTGDGFVPIAAPRGIPDDACAEYKNIAQQWEGDGHSHSYFTVAELLCYDWTQETRHHGVVNVKEWGTFTARGKPESWAGDVGGGNVKIYTDDEFKAAAAKLGLKKYDVYHDRANAVARLSEQFEGSPYCRVSWVEPYYKSAADFLANTMPRLWQLGGPENVRVVFFFDN